MAKITGSRQDMTLPALTDKVIIYEFRGQIFMRAWPKPRGKNLKDITILQNRKFKNAQMLAKYASPNQIAMSERMAHKGPLYPRDYITAAMTRGFYIFTFPGGRTVYPMSALIEISQELDVFSQNPGAILTRGVKYWEGVAPGLKWDLLYYPEDNTPPVPIAIGPETGGRNISSINRTNPDVSPNATKGWLFKPSNPLRVHSIVPSFAAIASAQYRCTIAETDGTKITAILSQTFLTTTPATTFRRFRFDMPDTPILSPPTQYLILFTRSDATAATSNGLWGSTSLCLPGVPTQEGGSWIKINSTLPIVNDTIVASGLGFPYVADIIYTF